LHFYEAAATLESRLPALERKSRRFAIAVFFSYHPLGFEQG
jgi:hypothetical protein